MDIPNPPEGWDLDWIVNRWDGSFGVRLQSRTEYVMGKGSSPRYSMLDALKKIEDGLAMERRTVAQTVIFKAEKINIASLLPKVVKEPLKRRF